MSSQPVRRPRDRKETIIREAAELFHEKGFHNVALGEIAAAVGISAPALYRHFKGKTDLLAGVLSDSYDRLQRATDAASSAEDALHGLAGVVAERRELAVLWQRETRHLPEERREETLRRMRETADRIAQLVRRDRPELSTAGADLLTWALLSVGASPGHHRVACPADRLQERIATLLVTLLRDGVVRDDAPDTPSPATGGGLALASRRENLIGAATRLFGSRGFHEVSLDDIGAAAGIAGPSVYKHFSSKGEILFETLNRGAAVLQLGMIRAMSTAHTPEGALDALTIGYVEMCSAHTDLIAALVTEVLHLPDDQRHTIRRIQHDYVAEWVELLSRVRPELDQTDAQLTVHAALGMINDVLRVGHLRARPQLAQELAGFTHLLLIG